MRIEPAPLSLPRSHVSRTTDLLWLALLCLVLIATGIGVRNPWPADEPRFALIARDMVQSGQWLFPRVGGDLYADKPPLFFWLLAVAYALTGSVRASFLLPSLFASGGILWLVYDLVRRISGRSAALCAAVTLACCVQFLLAARSAQIDITLCFFTTLSLYALLRHFLLGPAWGWYFIGAVAAGLGIITKGVGFLPLLVLLPYVILRLRQKRYPPDSWILPPFKGGARWLFIVAGLLLGVSVWLAPMLTGAARGDQALMAYRDEILFQQTLTRYASAWHHVRPGYYFLVEVIPLLWFPVSVLLFWLIPRWLGAWRACDARVWLPLGWVVLVVAFFSLSAGKRGIYVLPALPATVLAAAAYLPDIYGRLGLKRVAIWPALLALLALIWSYGVSPRIDARRSGRALIEAALERLPASTELGLVAYKEQFLLYLDRPVVNFGHARWREGQREAEDAARWLNAAPGRLLLLPATQLDPCFAASPREAIGEASRETWFLVRPPAVARCAERGDPKRAIRYAPQAPERRP